MPGTHRGCCATTALLLCLAAAASAAAEDVIPTDIGALHAEAQQRWETQRAHRYLDDIGNERRRAVVGRVCGGILDEEERWMCEKRGAHLAERMEGYQKISRADLADMLEEHGGRFRKKYARLYTEAGLWFSIVDGRLDEWGTFGYALPWKDAWHLVMGRVLECIKNGAIEPGQTFDYVVMFSDGGYVVSHSPFSDGLPRYPVAKYSYTPTNKPHHFAMPWFEGWQIDEHLTTRPYLPYENLTRQACTRNGASSLPRMLLSMLSGSGFNPLLNVAMVHKHEIHQRGYCKELLPKAIAALKAEHARDPTAFELEPMMKKMYDPDHDALCNALVFRDRMDWDEYVSHRYLVSQDAILGAVNRLWRLLEAPGVTMPVLESHRTFQEYYFRDALPFLHYVPVTDHIEKIAANITVSLQWLEQHQATAKYIGEESTRWVGKHKTHKTDMRQYKLYFALLSDMYVPDAARKLPRRSQRPLRCTPEAETFLFYGEKGCNTEHETVCKKWPRLTWNLSCGPRSAGGDLHAEAANTTGRAAAAAPRRTEPSAAPFAGTMPKIVRPLLASLGGGGQNLVKAYQRRDSTWVWHPVTLVVAVAVLLMLCRLLNRCLWLG